MTTTTQKPVKRPPARPRRLPLDAYKQAQRAALDRVRKAMGA